jgi:hypothetical protein
LKKEFSAPINFLSQKGYGIIFLSHAKESDVEDGGRKFTKIDSTLPNTAKKVIHGLCDYIFYFYSDNEGKRLIRTKAAHNVNAGDRSGLLPEVLPMDAHILIDALSVEKKENKPKRQEEKTTQKELTL